MSLDKVKGYAQKRLVKFYNFFNDIGRKEGPIASDLPEFIEIKQRAARRTTINEHLVTLFVESLLVKPKIILELGVGKGESTFVLSRVAQLCGAALISVDRYDRFGVCPWEDWIFIHQDDVEFASHFEAWSQERNLEPRIDVLFIDTSHEYEQTCREIEAWFPFLPENSKVFFHDTNLRAMFFRQDGSMGLGWNNNRGVIRALEGFFGRTFDETRPFVDIIDGWLIKHEPYCCGFTVLHKIGGLGVMKELRSES